MFVIYRILSCAKCLGVICHRPHFHLATILTKKSTSTFPKQNAFTKKMFTITTISVENEDIFRKNINRQNDY